MEKGDRKDIEEEMLVKYLRAELSPQEKNEVEEWLSADPENRQRLLQIQVVLADTSEVKPAEIPTLDISDAFEKVKARKAQILAEKPLATRRSPFGLWLRIAAILVMGIAISVWFIANSNRQFEFVAENEGLVQKLKDGSTLTLSSASTLTFSPSSSKREAQLKGTGYFEVAKDPERPFIVSTENAIVTVLGTQFSVAEKIDQTIVSVEEGIVRVAAGQTELTLTKGQTASVNHQNGQLSMLEKQDTGEYRFWKTRALNFKATTLDKAVAVLNNAYETDIILNGDALADCTITVSFENESLDNALSIIALTLNLEVKRDGDKIILSGEGC